MKLRLLALAASAMFATTAVQAQNTTTSPTGGALPASVTKVGGVVVDLKGLNGNRVISQVAASTEFQGSPPPSQYPLLFATQNGFDSTVVGALGGGITAASFRISLFDGDSQAGNFDFNQDSLLVNGLNFGNFSAVTTYQTDGVGNQIGSTTLGFGDNILDTGFFSSTDVALLTQLFATLTSGKIEFRLADLSPGDQFFDFQQGLDSSVISIGSGPVVTPPVAGAVPEPATWAMMIMGFGLAGFALRRAARRSDAKFDAKIKSITAGALA